MIFFLCVFCSRHVFVPVFIIHGRSSPEASRSTSVTDVSMIVLPQPKQRTLLIWNSRLG